MNENLGITFQAFMRLIDARVAQLTGLGVHDFADIMFRDIYDDAYELDEAVAEVLEELEANDGIFAGFMELGGI